MLPFYKLEEFYKKIKKRGYIEWENEGQTVKTIIQGVKERGDEAVNEYTRQFDGVNIDRLAVTEKEFAAAYRYVAPDFINSLQEAKENIVSFHRRQKENSWFIEKKGFLAGQMVRPLKRVGAYVPGGAAAYPSSVLMTVVPAVVAGVKDVVLCTPPGKKGEVNPHTLVAAAECGVNHIFKAGGAQAVGAMAYGTATIPAVEKIVGPGNIYVTLAKKYVFGTVGIDMLAGPSEVMVVADNTGDPAYIAADLLAQAEHDPLAAVYLIVLSKPLLLKVQEELEKQLKLLGRREIACRSLEEQGAALVLDDLAAVWPLVNEVAPEHLGLHLENPWQYLGEIENAGAVFLGSYTPEALGDYWSGPNHVLPTSGSARFASPLGVYDFLKRSSILSYTPEAFDGIAGNVEILARVEGLDAHARAVNIRRRGQR